MKKIAVSTLAYQQTTKTIAQLIHMYRHHEIGLMHAEEINFSTSRQKNTITRQHYNIFL